MDIYYKNFFLLQIYKNLISCEHILILDEPTSNLDTLNEAEILKSINNECKDKSIVMVSHRKSSVSICDKKIYVKNNTLNLA